MPQLPDNPSAVPVIVFGSSLTALGVIRGLGRAGVPQFSVCDPKALPVRSRWYRPLSGPFAPVAERLSEFLEQLDLTTAVLIPCADDWAHAIAALGPKFGERFRASISPLPVIETMTDKWKFAQMLQRLGLPHPETRLLTSAEEMAGLEESDYVGRFLKPLNSQQFSERYHVKAFLIHSKAEALAKMKKAENDGLPAFPILLQDYIPGPPTGHYFVDGFVDRRGTITTLFARRRLRMFPPLLGNSTLMETVPLEEVSGAIETIREMWSRLHYRGIFSAEFKRDPRDGHFKILEVNARPWWFIEFAQRCGIDVCSMSYRDALGLPIERAKAYPIGRRCVYLRNDFEAWRDDPKGSSFFEWVRSWIRAEPTMFSLDDPKPAVVSLLRTLERMLLRRRPK